MLNRDFTKSNKEYIKNNKIPLIVLTAFLLVGVLVMAIFGFNGNFEFTGYNEFYVTIGTSIEADKCTKKIENIVNSYGGEYDAVAVFDEGDDTRLVIRYVRNLSDEKQQLINSKISETISIDLSEISDHTHIGASVHATDYIFTAVAILLILVIGTIFAYFRYNSASALVLIICNLLATLGLMSISAIFRLSVGLSYFAMQIILNVLVTYLAMQVFEHIRAESYLDANDYANAINSAMKKVKFQSCVISVVVLLVGVLFVIFAPNPIKYVSLNILFIAVVLLATITYVLPFVWSIFITKSKRHKIKKQDKSVKVAEEIIEQPSLDDTNDTTGNATIGG